MGEIMRITIDGIPFVLTDRDVKYNYESQIPGLGSVEQLELFGVSSVVKLIPDKDLYVSDGKGGPEFLVSQIYVELQLQPGTEEHLTGNEFVIKKTSDGDV